MSLEESNKTSKEIPSQDSLSNPRPEEEIAAQLAYAENSEWLDKTYNNLVESGNDYSPDVTDMLWTAARKEALRNDKEFVNHKILDCIGDLMLSGHRIFGHIKTSQGGHQLTNRLLREFLSNKSNWEFENFDNKQKDQKGNVYPRPIAINA